MTDFYLVSTELREPYEPRACRIVRRLSSELRDDLALVEIRPPLPKHVYSTEKDVDCLVLAAKHEGQSLFSASELPMAVYICRTTRPLKPGEASVPSSELSIIDWGKVLASD